MEFFKTMFQSLHDGEQVNITICRTGQELTMSLVTDLTSLKDKGVKDNIKPLVLSGTPDDFEANFEDALKPVLKESSFVSNVKEYEESVEKAKAESDMEKKKKAEEKSQKDEFKKLVDLARKNNEAHKFKDAKKVLDKAAAIPMADKSVIKKVEQEIDQTSGFGSMFGAVEDLSDGKDTADTSKPNPSEDSEETEDEETED